MTLKILNAINATQKNTEKLQGLMLELSTSEIGFGMNSQKPAAIV